MLFFYVAQRLITCQSSLLWHSPSARQPSVCPSWLALAADPAPLHQWMITCTSPRRIILSNDYMKEAHIIPDPQKTGASFETVAWWTEPPCGQTHPGSLIDWIFFTQAQPGLKTHWEKRDPSKSQIIMVFIFLLSLLFWGRRYWVGGAAGSDCLFPYLQGMRKIMT